METEETLEAAIKVFCAAEGVAIPAAMAEVLRIGAALGYEESYIRGLVNDSLEAQALGGEG